ncbi:MAG: hypothetical protein ACOY4R_29880 [Pseudomonadota bacterium]
MDSIGSRKVDHASTFVVKGRQEQEPPCLRLWQSDRDDDVVFRAISALIKRDMARQLPVAASSGNGDRACKLFADALGVATADGVKMQKAIERRELAEARDEAVAGKGRTCCVFAPTAAGRQFAADYRAKLDGEGFPFDRRGGGSSARARPSRSDRRRYDAPRPTRSGQALTSTSAWPAKSRREAFSAIRYRCGPSDSRTRCAGP